MGSSSDPKGTNVTLNRLKMRGRSLVGMFIKPKCLVFGVSSALGAKRPLYTGVSAIVVVMAT